MIDVTTEEILSLNEARNRLPKRRQGKRPDVSTLYRWGYRGCKGVKLETIQIGGTKCTSVEALARFFAKLSEVAGIVAVGEATHSPTKHVTRTQIERELEREGL